MVSARFKAKSVLGSAVDRTVGALSPHVGEESALRPVLRSLKRRLPAPVDPLTYLIAEFAGLYPNAFFVQVGANDGSKGDYLDTYVRSLGWTGILIEPIPYVFDGLSRRHGSNPNLTLANVAIAHEDGTAELYYLPKDEHSDLPSWYDALATFRKDVLLKHEPWIPDIASRIQTIEVPTATFESLCRTYGVEGIDLLQIDTEGYDYEVIRQVDLDAHRPALILYEHLHLAPDDRRACEDLVHSHGYTTVSNVMDTVAIRIDDSDRRSRRLARTLEGLRAEPVAGSTNAVRSGAARFPSLVNSGLRKVGIQLHRVPRASGSDAAGPDNLDQTFDERFHGGRDSLPPGAEAYLRADNPRLLELRGSYARTRWPVSEHSRWRDEAVRGWLNLKYFRGDNIIIWHYRHGPENNRLFYFTYLRYLLDQGGRDLLERLGEDGAFGCWRFDFPGHPACSRDLLDSANELMFLDKHLSVFSRPGLRILDIGAGYGRLAYRASQSIQGLDEYCCVDAIAESTFLCEYYTGFREVAPPVRVVPLPEVPSLEEGGFDLAINVHSFSECRLAAIEWWMQHVARLQVPYLFVVPNEPDGFLTTEADGRRLDYLPAIEAAGYRLVEDTPVISDAAVREALGLRDRFCLFERV